MPDPRWRVIEWPSRKYSVILADPPWQYYGDQNRDQCCGKHYAMMSNADVYALRIQDILDKRGVVFLWATSPRLNVAMNALEAWGLEFRGVSFVWVKTTMAGKIINAQGVRPSIVKPTTEYVLAGSRVREGRPMPLLSERVAQVVLASRPGNAHSAKPAQVHERIEELYGDVPRIELFCRGAARPGWDAWGNEAEVPT